MGETPEINREINSFHEENILIFDTAMVSQCFNWNPLHVAASRGQQEVFKRLLDSNPELAEALDSQRRSLLHLASANGHLEIVEALIEVRPEMCLARDRDGANPLHVAAMRGKVEVLDVLFQANPLAAQARVDRGERETILHLCVKYNKLEFLKKLLEKFKNDDFVNATDDVGNTIVLHLAISELAVADQRFEIIQHVLCNTKIKVNATNANKQTEMDILLLRQGTKPEAVDRNIEDLLRSLHAKRDKDTVNPKWLTEQRNALIIVAVLIATIAFQAGVTHPGGVWPDTKHGRIGGEAVMAYKDPRLYRYFLSFNTMSFVASLSTILLLICEFPFKKRRYVWMLIVIMFITITSMVVTYALMIIVITPKWGKKTLSRTMVVGVAAWCSMIAIALTVHPIHSIANIVGEEKRRHQAVERLRKVGRAITGRGERRPRGNAIAPIANV